MFQCIAIFLQFCSSKLALCKLDELWNAFPTPNSQANLAVWQQKTDELYREKGEDRAAKKLKLMSDLYKVENKHC